MGKDSRNNIEFILFISIGILLRILLSFFTNGYFADIFIFKGWGYAISHYGFPFSYSYATNLLPYFQEIDYLPFPLYLFALIGKIYFHLLPSQFLFNNYIHGLFKILSFPFELFMWYWIYKKFGKKLLLIAIFLPVLIIDDYFLGSINLIDVSLAFVSVLLIDDYPLFSGFLMGISILSKPYGILFLPFLVYKYRDKMKFFIIGGIVSVLFILFPHIKMRTLQESLFAGYRNTQLMGSVSNGMNNIPFLFPFIAPIIYQIVYLLVYIYIFFMFIKKKTDLYESILMVIISFFFVFPYIHANHTAVRILFFLPLIKYRKYALLFVLTMIHSFVNMFYLYNPPIETPLFIFFVNAVFSVIILILLFVNKEKFTINISQEKIFTLFIIISISLSLLPFFNPIEKVSIDIKNSVDGKGEFRKVVPKAGIISMNNE